MSTKRIFCETYLAIFLWCTAYIVTKLGLSDFDNITMSVVRYLSIGICAVIFLVIRRIPLPRVKDIPILLCLSGTGFFLYVLTYNEGAKDVSVSTASVIIAAAPLLTAVFSWMFFREKVSRKQVVYMVLAMVGTTIVCLWDGVFKLNGSVIWIVLALICFTAYNLLIHYKSPDYSPSIITVYTLIIAGIFFSIFLFFIDLPDFRVSQGGYICSVYLGVACSGLAYILWNRALNNTKQITKVTNALFTEPVITTLMGWMVFREIPSAGTLLGGILILIGLIGYERNRC